MKKAEKCWRSQNVCWKKGENEMNNGIDNGIKVCHLSKSFRRKKVLDDVNFTLETGICGILGPNGAGKTTLMRCITGLYPFDGEIKIAGKKLCKKTQMGIGYLPQKFGLYPELTVYEMMKYFCKLKKIPEKQTRDMIDRSLKMVNLDGEEKKQVKKLSGGMVRRLGIAQAFLGEASIVLLDEPTAGLDPEERMRFKNIITNMGRDKLVIVSTHIVEDVEACCDHIMVLEKGHNKFLGRNDDLISRAEGKIMELREDELAEKDILFTEKTFIRDGKKMYRVITKQKTEHAVPATVEDGYLCVLKEDY